MRPREVIHALSARPLPKTPRGHKFSEIRRLQQGDRPELECVVGGGQEARCLALPCTPIHKEWTLWLTVPKHSGLQGNDVSV